MNTSANTQSFQVGTAPIKVVDANPFRKALLFACPSSVAVPIVLSTIPVPSLTQGHVLGTPFALNFSAITQPGLPQSEWWAVVPAGGPLTLGVTETFEY